MVPTDDVHEDAFRSFGARLEWLLVRAGAPANAAPIWLYKQFQDRGFKGERQTMREWVRAGDHEQPNERSVRAICKVLGANPAWLRYGVGAPLADTGAGTGGGYTAVQALAEEVADLMEGMRDEEFAAELVRRGVRRAFGRREMRKLYNVIDERLDLLRDTDELAATGHEQATERPSAG